MNEFIDKTTRMYREDDVLLSREEVSHWLCIGVQQVCPLWTRWKDWARCGYNKMTEKRKKTIWELFGIKLRMC
jgi:hypothetical protein